ncbi:hypothetical protein H5410_003347 [Solanum commersonii]|uniref:Uncharacterized protein n=1 Tax=Solanum commersonii TaxID=4109 RepID=A0A9J6B4F4_SOLCO|nr:hypothetical protein H5410_003347 [Solanum commersonii]
MGDALAVNEVQTERNRRQRRDGHVPTEEPTSTPLHIGSSEIDFDDMVRAMDKQKKVVEVEWVKAKRATKLVKKLAVKKDNVIKKAPVKPKPVKGPGSSVQKPVEVKVLTREERIAEMEKQNVLNGRVFDPKILTKYGMSTLFDSVSLQNWEHLFKDPAPYLYEPEEREFYYMIELLNDGGIRTTVKVVKMYLNEESLGIILSVLSEGIRSVEGWKPSIEFTERATKRGDIKCAGLPKKFLLREYQLLFEFINKDRQSNQYQSM